MTSPEQRREENRIKREAGVTNRRDFKTWKPPQRTVGKKFIRELMKAVGGHIETAICRACNKEKMEGELIFGKCLTCMAMGN